MAEPDFLTRQVRGALSMYPTSTGGGSAADLFLQGMAEQGLDPDNPAAMAAASGADPESPLVWASMSVGQRMSLLPKWARDLKIVDMAKMDEPEGFVYMSDYARRVPGVENPTEFDTPQGFREGGVEAESVDTDKAQSITRAKNLPYLWDEAEVDAAMKRMQDAGLNVTSFEDLQTEWDKLVVRASNTYMLSKGERKVTPWDVLDLIKREDESANGGEDDPNRRVVTRSKSIAEISEGEAWSVLQRNLSSMLGRDPSDQEVRDFTHRMNTLAARNPAITKTIQQYKNGDVVSETNRTISTGLTEGDIAQSAYEDAQADPEYGAYQAGATYFNAAIGALGAIGNV